MYDLIKSGKIAGSRVLKIILNNLQYESAVDVLQDTLSFVVPAILDKFLHPEVHEIWSTKMFELTLIIMKLDTFNRFNSAMETLLTSAINFAQSEDSVKLISKWFLTGKVTDAIGVEIAGAQVNVKIRHTMVRKIFSSSSIPSEQKKECLTKLAEFDQSDMLGRT